MSLTASRAREHSQTNDPKHKVVSTILTDLIFRRNPEEEQYYKTIIKQAKERKDRAKCIKMQNQHNNSINSNIYFDLGFSKSKDKKIVPYPLNPSIKKFAEKSMNQTASELNGESLLARSKLPTN